MIISVSHFLKQGGRLSSGGRACWLANGRLLVWSPTPPSVDVSLSKYTAPDLLAVALHGGLHRRCVLTACKSLWIKASAKCKRRGVKGISNILILSFSWHLPYHFEFNQFVPDINWASFDSGQTVIPNVIRQNEISGVSSPEEAARTHKIGNPLAYFLRIMPNLEITKDSACGAVHFCF